MNPLLYIAVTFVVIILVVFGIRYGANKREEQKVAKANEEAELKEKIEEIICVIGEMLPDRMTYLTSALLHADHFFTDSECKKFEKDTKELYEHLDFLRCNGALQQLGEDATKFYVQRKNLELTRKKHNEEFVTKELEQQKDFFDSVLEYPLDNQQRDSIVKLEDNCLVISSAGSGKTSTMIGKLLYLVHQRKIQPSRILTITYTHKASDELTQRLTGTGLSCMTFHKLAMNIVSKVEGRMPSIADNGLFVKVFYDQLNKPEFKNAILNYLTDYKSLVRDEHAYYNSIEYYKDRRKYGVIALYTDKDDRLISTKSEEEKKICSYLTELGVSFKYEEPYEYETLTEEYRQYKPDFTIYYKDKEGMERKLYLEHYAINSSGQVPRWFGNGMPDGWNAANQRYHEGIEWKKNVHREHGTKLIFTTSADFHNKSIRPHLRNLLIEAGVPINEATTDELIEKIMSRNKSMENALMQMTQSFVNLVKANGKTIEDIRNIAEARHSIRDIYVIDNIMKPLWDDYQKELSEREEMDFTDVIVKATNYCNEGKWGQKYEFILIDEFQDISVDRYRFLQSLRTNLPKTKLYCVGDDWQSIYRFTGSDLSLFSEFSKYFGYTEECKIETTYRFGNPLIDKSSRFVQHNPLQKKKKVHPRAVNPPETNISFMAYKSNQDLQSLMEKMVARVPTDKTAYIISRYSYDVRVLASPSIKMEYDPNSDNVTLQIAGRKVKFMTIHASKGLEADYVFVLNCNSGLYGFPSLLSDDPVLDYVLSDKEHYEYAEERRVYYVAITRAKVHTVVMYNENTPSPFVTEMNADMAINPNPCPWCGVGHRIVKYEGWTKQKTPYKVWGCDNKEANCQYFEREFYNGRHMNLSGRKYIPAHRVKR
ncbi:MAG: UvrD-helicase domain-containing protein [Bacteroidaceae bacterium]|nr:UvrD-helicase domain-containing protein [Bacteroidaceae bacterium]